MVQSRNLVESMLQTLTSLDLPHQHQMSMPSTFVEEAWTILEALTILEGLKKLRNHLS